MKKIKKIKNVEKRNTLANKIINLLNSRRDVTRLMLPTLMNAQLICVDRALTRLRKIGIKIWAVNGPGTPLKIVNSQTDMVKYNVSRRAKYLPTAHRMYIVEMEAGEQYKELAGSSDDLIKKLTTTTDND